jgi:hypothetical protein
MIQVYKEACKARAPSLRARRVASRDLPLGFFSLGSVEATGLQCQNKYT